MKKMCRCEWVPEGDTLYEEYHDREWGVPVYDDQKIFEFLCLESAQAGLSWRTILNKRDGYRKVFKNFDVLKVSKMKPAEIEKALKNPAIVRNRLKVEATVNNAKRFLEIQKEFGTFAKYIWAFVGGKPKINRFKTLEDVPAKTDEAEALSKDLKKRGFKFMGPTIVYAHMQAAGMVNDHVVGCFRYKEV